ncbi:MAG: ankyrin repeat domain-containing protein [Candidatus Dependentiae bacterium]|nr:ankyrin repeat domain-containing protein [Candidatus Dependentiae bacterium]
MIFLKKYAYKLLLCTMICSWVSLEALTVDEWLDTKAPLLSIGIDVNFVCDDGSTSLMAIACRGDVELLEASVKMGADVNAKTFDGWTALMFAALYNHTEAVKALIRLGAGMDSENKYRDTALTIALGKNYQDIVRLLLQSGSKTDYIPDSTIAEFDEKYVKNIL